MEQQQRWAGAADDSLNLDAVDGEPLVGEPGEQAHQSKTSGWLATICSHSGRNWNQATKSLPIWLCTNLAVS